ncbi:MAG TPA: aldose 1-epimerase family protein [Holophagaceae bacterium]|nr:aldose 1-epimerase family protein [Holophagaceae bacterium]
MSLRLEAGPYAAAISPQGAELQTFRWRGQDLLWHGDPAWWGRRAPLLFPVVGGVAGGQVRMGGLAFPMPKHGFARDLPWEVREASMARAELVLRDSSATRLHYPFAFELRIAFTLSEAGLRQAVHLANPGLEPLPAQFGFHPAFRWPLFPGEAKEAHRLTFDAPEPGPLRRLEADLLSPERRPTPVEGNVLPLRDDLFEADALIWEAPASRGLRYGIPGRPCLRMTWEAPSFACWTRPGAPFLCLEPWQGLADPEGFTGELAERPGAVTLPPGGTTTWALNLAVEDGAQPIP